MKLYESIINNIKETEDDMQLKQEIVDTVNNGQVFEFSVGPQMTICSRYENGSYTYYYSSGDCPMWRFEIEMVPHLKDKFVVVDDNIGKISRASRFKKYGYKVVGEIKETKKGPDGYSLEDDNNDYGDTWILMEKK